MAQVAQSDPHSMLERPTEPATAGDNPSATSTSSSARELAQTDRQRRTHRANVPQHSHLRHPPAHFREVSTPYKPDPSLPAADPPHNPTQPQDLNPILPSNTSTPPDDPKPDDIAQPGATTPSPPLPHSSDQPIQDYPEQHSPPLPPSDSAVTASAAGHPVPPHNNPAVMGLVASFGEMSMAPMPYPQPPPMPMMGTVIPLVPPQISPHQQRHHQQHHHHHHLQHPHLLNQPTTYQLWVPQERVGAVIGGQGTVIRSLQERSGATIQVHNDTVRGDRKLFTIFGTLAQYDIAKQLISDIVEKPRQSHGSSHAGPHSTSDRSPYSQSGDHGPRSGDVWKTVYVPTSCVGLVIGRNGETIRNLQDRSGADIKVTPDEEAQPGADTRSILLSGTDEAISTAHQLVSEIVMDAKSRRPPHSGPQVGFALNGQSLVFEVLSIPNEKVGLIIGKKGATIRDLQMRSGAKIQVTKDESSVQSDGTRPVTLTGMRANVDEAKAMIASKINMPMSQSSTASPVYNNSPPQPGPSSTSPGGPSQPGPGYMVPNLYEPAFQNGQQPFQQGYDANDANAQSRAMAYFQYVGYNNYMAQQRQFQSHMPMHFPIPQQQQLEQQAPSANSSQDQQEASGQPSQYSPTPLQQGQQLESIQGSPGIAQRDASGNIVMYPAQQYQQLSPHMAGHQMYSTGPPNRMFSRREQVQAAQVRAQMVMHAQAHAHAQAQAQAHAQAQAEAQGESEARLQTHEPLVPTPEDDG